MKAILNLLFSGIITLLLSACGGGGGGGDGAACTETTLDENYVNITVTTDGSFVSDHIDPGTPALMYQGVSQGGSYEIDKVMFMNVVSHLDPVSEPNTSLAVAFSVLSTQAMPADAYMALYLDTDHDINTGFSVGGIGADLLIFESVGGSSPGGGSNDGVYSWGSGWYLQSKYPNKDTSSKFAVGCSQSVAVIVPWYPSLGGIDPTTVKGFMMFGKFLNNDPNTAAENGVISYTIGNLQYMPQPQ